MDSGEWTFLVDEAGKRLDQYLAERCPNVSRSRLAQLIREGNVALNQTIARPAQSVRVGDRVFLRIPPATPDKLQAQDIPIDVLYEDDDLLVVDKPSGMPVHPSPGHPASTLVNALLARCRDLSGIGGVIRPGIVHRLDKDTSGLMIVAKHDTAHVHLADQFKARSVYKAYLTLLSGVLARDEGLVKACLGRDPHDRKRMAVIDTGREACTRYRVIRRFRESTLVEAFPETGRTHQLRVHFLSLGHPIAGDRLYGMRRMPFLERQFLHAHSLQFRSPGTGQKIHIQSPLPEGLQRVLEVIGTQ